MEIATSSKPVRIQRKMAKGFNLQAASPNGLPVVYVGRPTKWGNPFISCRDGHPGYNHHSVSPAIAVQLFRNMLHQTGAWSSIPPSKWPKGKIPAQWTKLEDVKLELQGKNLACWCPLDQPCHADLLLEIANVD